MSHTGGLTRAGTGTTPWPSRSGHRGGGFVGWATWLPALRTVAGDRYLLRRRTAGATARWAPARPDDPAAASAGRGWAREALPRLLRRTPDPALAEIVELLLTELISNAVRHAGGIREARITSTPRVVRISVRDDDPRRPVPVSDTGPERVDGRGLVLVEALGQRWGVRRRVSGGKDVWVDLPVRRS